MRGAPAGTGEGTGMDRQTGDEDGDHRLLAAAGQGNQGAFKTLMLRHTKRSLALAQRMLGEPSSADEIVQEAFLRAWNVAPRWNPDRSARFTTWLYRVIVNLCLDRRRRRRPQSMEDLAALIDDGPNGLMVVAARERRKLVTEALLALPDRQRAAITLFYFSELSGQEASEVLGMSVEGFESLLARGRRALRARLAELGVEHYGDLT